MTTVDYLTSRKSMRKIQNHKKLTFIVKHGASKLNNKLVSVCPLINIFDPYVTLIGSVVLWVCMATKEVGNLTFISNKLDNGV